MFSSTHDLVLWCKKKKKRSRSTVRSKSDTVWNCVVSKSIERICGAFVVTFYKNVSNTTFLTTHSFFSDVHCVHVETFFNMFSVLTSGKDKWWADWKGLQGYSVQVSLSGLSFCVMFRCPWELIGRMSNDGTFVMYWPLDFGHVHNCPLLICQLWQVRLSGNGICVIESDCLKIN